VNCHPEQSEGSAFAFLSVIPEGNLLFPDQNRAHRERFSRLQRLSRKHEFHIGSVGARNRSGTFLSLPLELGFV
jgi:hypothetical protein